MDDDTKFMLVAMSILEISFLVLFLVFTYLSNKHPDNKGYSTTRYIFLSMLGLVLLIPIAFALSR